MVKPRRHPAQHRPADRLELEQRRVLAANETILSRYRDEGAGAVLEDARRNAEAAQAVFDPGDPVVASVLMVLGAICDSVGEIAEAEDADRRALEILRVADDPDGRLQLATLFRNMAVREDGRLDLRAAIDLREQALSVYRALLPEVDQRIGAAVQNLAVTWEASGEGVEADRVLAEHVALAVSQGADADEVAARGPFATALPYVLDRTASRLEREGKLDAAEHFHRRAVNSADVRRADDRLARLSARSNLALLLERRGRFDEARTIMIAALEDLDADAADDPDALDALKTQLLNNLGHLQYRSGDLRGALAFHEEALGVRQARFGDDDPAVAESLNNLGLVRAAMGDLPGAAELMGAAYRIREHESSPELIDLINNLGWIARASGEAATARALYEEALRRRRLLYGDRHPAVAESLNNLGVACLAAGEVEAARRLLQEGLDLRRAIYGPQHPEVVASLVNLANALMAAGNLEEAGEHLNVAWVTQLMVDPAMETPATNGVLFSLAQHALLRGDPGSALEALEGALDHENRMTASILGLGSERDRLLRLAAVRGHGDALISVALDHSPDPGALATRVYRQVLRRKAMDLAFLAVQRAAVGGGSPSKGGEPADELDRARAELGRAVLDGLGANITAARRARVEALEADLARSIPGMWLVGDGASDLDGVLAALTTGTVLVDFVRCGVWDPAGPFEAQWPSQRYVAFLASADDPSVRMIDLGDARAIDVAIADHRGEMLGIDEARDIGAQPNDAPAGSNAGEELRRLVIDPLRPLPDGARRLAIVPDGMLHLVSFAALPLNGGTQLLDAYELSTLSSALGLRHLARSFDPAVAGPPLVLGDPDFDLDGDVAGDGADGSPPADLAARGLPDAAELRHAIPALPATAAEARAVGAVLRVEPVTGSEADKGRVMNAHRPIVLHLATHGFFLPATTGALDVGGSDAPGAVQIGVLDDPLLRCGLVLAGANRWLETGQLHPRAGDGFLTGLDVLALDLEGTQLVVLSACDTARGEILDGEGVLGLSRAFGSAGAESLVMSLWKVPDEQTAQLMTVFYERLGQGDEIPSALRGAQLAIRARHPHPANWAAFICQGVVAPLTLPVVAPA